MVAKIVSGKNLRTELEISYARQVSGLLKGYFSEITKENPRLVNMQPPYGVADIRQKIKFFSEPQGIRNDGFNDYIFMLSPPKRCTGFMIFSDDGFILNKFHLYADATEEKNRRLVYKYLLTAFAREVVRRRREGSFHHLTPREREIFSEFEQENLYPELEFESMSRIIRKSDIK